MRHDHAHDHTRPKDLGPAFRWAVALNTAYVIVEATAGLLTGSLALLADAAHNLTDVAGLLIAWAAAVLAKRAATRAHSWGLVVSGPQDTDAVLHDLAEGLENGFAISHSTIQVERVPCGANCLRVHA